jgi:hypothetical protein
LALASKEPQAETVMSTQAVQTSAHEVSRCQFARDKQVSAGAGLYGQTLRRTSDAVKLALAVRESLARKDISRAAGADVAKEVRSSQVGSGN